MARPRPYVAVDPGEYSTPEGARPFVDIPTLAPDQFEVLGPPPVPYTPIPLTISEQWPSSPPASSPPPWEPLPVWPGSPQIEYAEQFLPPWDPSQTTAPPQ